MTEQEIKSMWGNEVLRIGKICGKYEKGGIDRLTKEEIDELVRRKLIELPKPKFPDNLPDEFQGLDFEFVERLGIYVAKKRTLFDKTFNDSDKILKENKGKKVVVVTHGGAIRTLMPHLLNVPLAESFKYDPKHLSFTIFDFDGKKFSKVCIDDTSHLDREE